MTSKEWNNLTDKEKRLYRKGLTHGIEECMVEGKITKKECEKMIADFDKLLKALSEIK